jgi:hypothetical protein
VNPSTYIEAHAFLLLLFRSRPLPVEGTERSAKRSKRTTAAAATQATAHKEDLAAPVPPLEQPTVSAASRAIGAAAAAAASVPDLGPYTSEERILDKFSKTRELAAWAAASTLADGMFS